MQYMYEVWSEMLSGETLVPNIEPSIDMLRKY